MAGLVMCLVLLVQLPSGKVTLPPEWVEIDGAKTPELIPEHVTWGGALDTIALLVEKDVTTEGPLTALQLADADRQLVFDEAARHRKRRAACDLNARRAAEALTERTPDKEIAVLRAETLKCREALLDAKDRLLRRLTVEGAAELERWALDERRNTRVFMPRSEVEFWKLPR
jgi:hypothetical protein